MRRQKIYTVCPNCNFSRAYLTFPKPAQVPGIHCPSCKNSWRVVTK